MTTPSFLISFIVKPNFLDKCDPVTISYNWIFGDLSISFISSFSNPYSARDPVTIQTFFII